ncbi:MAG: DUF2062 domain-containing protein [Lentisphaerae bacterium]|nr:DUF2062 domain-containing protein [Lentisphaerota bacterium]
MIRHRGTPESVGRGIAVGLFSAFTVPVGHMLIAFLLAILVRGARTASVLVTWVANPLTIPFFYPFQCYIGSFIIGEPLSYALIKQLVMDALRNPSVRTAGALSGQLMASFFAGGLLLGSIAALTGYFIATAVVRRQRTRRARKLALRIGLRKAEQHV